MTPVTISKVLFILSSLMALIAAGEIAFALLAKESLSTRSYTMIFLTMVNAALFFIVALNLKNKTSKEESDR